MRGRPEESNIDPNFLEGLQRYHEDWLYYKNSSFPVPAPVLVVNAGLPKERELQTENGTFYLFCFSGVKKLSI